MPKGYGSTWCSHALGIGCLAPKFLLLHAEQYFTDTWHLILAASQVSNLAMTSYTCSKGGNQDGPRVRLWECRPPSHDYPQGPQPVPVTLTSQLSDWGRQMVRCLHEAKSQGEQENSPASKKEETTGPRVENRRAETQEVGSWRCCGQVTVGKHADSSNP